MSADYEHGLHLLREYRADLAGMGRTLAAIRSAREALATSTRQDAERILHRVADLLLVADDAIAEAEEEIRRCDCPESLETARAAIERAKLALNQASALYKAPPPCDSHAAQRA